MEQRIRLGTTTTLVSYPRLRPDDLLRGIPSAPQVRVWGPDLPAPVAYGVAVVDALAATVTADADAGSTEIAVSSASWVRGRRYLLTSGADVLDVEAVTSGVATTLRLLQPLPIDVASGATIAGFAVTRVLTLAETQRVGEASALWRAVVAGVVVDWSQLFRVVARIPTALLTPTRLTHAYPTILSMAPPTDITLEGAIASSWEHTVVPLCEIKGVFDEDVISDEALVPLHALATVRLLWDFDPRIDPAFVDRIAKRFEECVETTFARRGYAERKQVEDPLPRVPAVDEGRTRLRLRP